ncbi:MAG: hypothetical protein V1779_05000 [bacterium]
MKKIIIINIVLLMLFSCDLIRDDYDKFSAAYKKILVAREIYQNDLLKSNKEVEKIYKEFGYNEESFKEEYFDLARKNPKIFQEILDSLRETTQRELIEYQDKFRNIEKNKE